MQEFDTPAAVSAVVDIPAGRIRFIAGDRARTTVEVGPADVSKGRDVKAAGQIAVWCEGGVVRVQAPSGGGLLGGAGAVEVTVQVPAGSRVEAKAAAAELRGVGRLGEVVVDGAHGVITLEEAAGVRLTALAGDVFVGRLTGPAEITTGKGDITIAEATGGEVDLRTEHGAISVGAARGVGASLDAGTGCGRIANTLRNTGAAAGLAIRATTAYGDITARSL